MEAILTDLLKFGIAGIMTAVVVIITWTLLKRSLDNRETDLEWHRDELDRKRQEYLACMTQQQSSFFSALERMEKSWEKMTESICQQLKSIEQRLPRYPGRQRDDTE